MQCLHNGIYSNPYCQRNFIVSSADILAISLDSDQA